MHYPHVQVERESFDQFYSDAAAILAQHWQEIGQYRDIPLEIDAERYRLGEAAGLIRIYVARNDAGEIIGYCVMFINTDAHHKSSIVAIQDALYVDPKFRASGIGLRILRHVEGDLSASGVQVVQQHVHVEHQRLRTILERRGYVMVDLVLAKRLDLD